MDDLLQHLVDRCRPESTVVDRDGDMDGDAVVGRVLARFAAQAAEYLDNAMVVVTKQPGGGIIVVVDGEPVVLSRPRAGVVRDASVRLQDNDPGGVPDGPDGGAVAF